MAQFKDDKMEYIESDIEKIQMKTGMYISYVGRKGALHLAKEVYDQKIKEQQILGELVMDAFVKLGQFSKQLPKATKGNDSECH